MSDDRLELDYDEHVYTFAGQRVGGVSEILQALGVIDDRWFTEAACRRGTAVHMAIEYWLRGTLDEASVDDRIRGYLEAAQRFVREAEVDVASALIEESVYHPALRYAGTIDLVARTFGKLSVVDWKSGSATVVGIQTAAYDQAFRAEREIRAPLGRFAVKLNADGTYKCMEQTNPMDYVVWQAAATVFSAVHLPRLTRRA